MASCEIAVPHNLVRIGDAVVGLDAYFWNRLEEAYRRVLLVRPIRVLSREPRGVELSEAVAVEEQVEDLKSIAYLHAPPGPPGAVRASGASLLALKLLSLVAPFSLVSRLIEGRLSSMMPSREAQAARYLASKILERGEPIPLNTVSWLNVRVNAGPRGLIVETGSGRDKVYEGLALADKAFKAAVKRVITEKCGIRA